MTVELQHLIDRIQKEAVDAGARQAEEILAKARADADGIVKAAEARAREMVAKAEVDAKVFTDRSRQTLSQAARDLLISVGRSVEQVVGSLALRQTTASLTPDVIGQMLVKLAEGYAAKSGQETRVEVLLRAEDRDSVIAHLKKAYGDALVKGIQFTADDSISGGFRISLGEERVYHDFTTGTLAAALAALVRPQLAEIVASAVRDAQGSNGSGR